MFFSKSNRRNEATVTTNAAARSSRKGRRPAAASPVFETLESRELMSAASLDPQFGVGGKVDDNYGGLHDTANATCNDSYGRTYIAGTSDGELFVARYTKKGQLDNSFGLGGRTYLTTQGTAHADGIAFDGTDLTVVADDYGSHDIFIARVNQNGGLDKTFNSTGVKHVKFEVPFGYYDTLTQAKFSSAVGVDVRGGKITIAGTADAYVGEPSYDERFALARIKTNGIMDGSFGSGGFASNEFIKNDVSDLQNATCMTVQNNGKILVGGSSNGHWAISRFNTNGSLDTNFDYWGHTQPYFGQGLGSMTSLDVNDYGYIITGGFATVGNTQVWGLAMLNPNGTMKTDFGYRGDGTAYISTGGATGEVQSVKYESDGRFVALGESTSGNGNFQVARFNPNGTFDSGFGSGGYTYVDFKNKSDAPAAMVINSFDKITVVGSTSKNGTSDIAMARLMGKVCTYSLVKYSDGVAGQTSGAFLVHRDASDPYAFDSTVLNFTIGGTAKQGVDYTFGLSLPITFQPGQTTMYIDINTVKNYLPKTVRTVDIKLNADPSYNVGAGEVVIKILPS